MTDLWTPGPWATRRTATTFSVSAGNRRIAILPVRRDTPSEANASLIAAAPTMHEYLSRRAADGCAEAASILEAIDGNA